MKSIFVLFSIFLVSTVNAQKKSIEKPSVYFSHGKLVVSDNKRFIIFEDGTPFFYLGDTAWELFHRLNKSDAEKYLENRRSKGFTVIQAVVLAELDGLKVPNANGDLPLFENDPLKPNGKYFEYVDWVIKKAERKGLFIGLLPTWGDKVESKILNINNGYKYGQWIAERYKNYPNIIWINGGDRAGKPETIPVWDAIAQGIKSIDKNHLMSYHPDGRNGSSTSYHNSEWLDFNMRQNGHSASYTESYLNTKKDYNLSPAKPVIDGEPIYEDIGILFDPIKNGFANAADVRRPLYWNLFSGAFGHTYGNNAVWQMWTPERTPMFSPFLSWDKAINQPGAEQMQYARWLLESRPFITRIPDDLIIISDTISTLIPGAGINRFVATRDITGTYALIYVPVGRPFKVNMEVVKSKIVKCWWYNPRNGKADLIGSFSNTGQREFNSPDRGENIDWILVIDDASKNYPSPGTR